MFQIILLILAIAFSVDSIARLARGSINLGVASIYIITISLWVYSLFFDEINAFASHGIGFAMKIAFFVCVFIMLCIMVFLWAMGQKSKAKTKKQVVIVLGAGLIGKKVSSVLAKRLNEAIKFYRKHGDIIIVVTGGQGHNEIIPEAHAMKEYLLLNNIPEEKIIVEDKSKSTKENFKFAMQLLNEKGINGDVSMAFSTNTFHIFRSMGYAKLAGFSNVSSLPSRTGLFSVLPCYIREVFALVHFIVFNRKR